LYIDNNVEGMKCEETKVVLRRRTNQTDRPPSFEIPASSTEDKADIAYRSLSRTLLPNSTLQAILADRKLHPQTPHQLSIFVEGSLETINYDLRWTLSA
jgi:hypothetical protein